MSESLETIVSTDVAADVASDVAAEVVAAPAAVDVSAVKAAALRAALADVRAMAGNVQRNLMLDQLSVAVVKLADALTASLA